MSTPYRCLRLIMGDQLNARHSWFSSVEPDVLYVLAELKEEATYVKHHVQKICAFFAAMQNFAQALSQSGHQVLHLNLDQSHEYERVTDLVEALSRQHYIQEFEYQTPDEYRVRQALQQLDLGPGVAIKEVDTEHFLLPFDEIPDYFKKAAHNRMESFYRKMRVRHHILVDQGEPEGGKWNFDHENRKRLSVQQLQDIPEPLVFSQDVGDILERIQRHQIPSFGEAKEQLIWPVSRTEALSLLSFFCEHCLPNFGHFQDAMTDQTPHAWSLYHSRLSFALNAKMLHPMQVIQAAVDAYRCSDQNISIAQVEGFVRQILGWREYVRGMYWTNMPEYESQNALQAQSDLPDYFWTAKTRMNCMHQSIQQSLDYAYAHHIQRLMVTGNFCLLTGIEPEQVDDWYLGIYVDALQWVELPNTRGMSQFADGGWVATKPYAASGNYIHKMSDYCRNCEYDIKQKTADSACPFNSLYWDFMIRHRERFERNPRIGMIYRNWDKQAPEQRQATLTRASWCLSHLDQL